MLVGVLNLPHMLVDYQLNYAQFDVIKTEFLPNSV